MALFSGLNERKITHQPGNTGPALRVAAKISLSALFIAHLEQPNYAPNVGVPHHSIAKF
ncbi:hypothetical protein TERTU_1290 [Teredinibacter turnerae T7901]|uniref:Uncharacterized protein n=1 Tax=Teredinibacter turnerae (strain ATCC 39867 / T7901) TaxID=377629 RepID=C5BRX3_TERTT|nr:hypothetical protein TERTU_1290 [Teredinibacter turnerae T7901]